MIKLVLLYKSGVCGKIATDAHLTVVFCKEGEHRMMVAKVCSASRERDR